MTLDLRSASYSLSSVTSSTESPRVRTDVSDELLTLTLDRPERRNALDPAMRDELAAALDDAARSRSIRAVVITGAGAAFCAGGDLGAFDDLHDTRVYRHVSHQLTAALDAVERLEKPVIAAIGGVATGAGLTLALCCDWRIAGPGARLLFGEGRLGLVPTHGGITRLVKLVGLAHLAADTDLRSGMLAESLAQTALLASDGHREGLAAARERREPEFAGR